MGISVAVIMRNEEANVADFMKSCLLFADEIVINDTGSTDRSVQFAKMWPKVKVYQTLWQDNFSLARNFAISKCTQDWIVWLDLDDRMDEKSAELITFLSETAEKQAVFMFNVKCKQPNTSDLLNIVQVRMFHRDSGVKFERAIHENTEKSILENGLRKYHTGEIDVIHEGYSDFELLKKKAKRNIAILNKEEVSFSNYYDLGKSYAVLQKFIMAEAFFSGAYEMASTMDQKNLIASSMLSFFIEKVNVRKIKEWQEKLVGECKITYYYKAESQLALGNQEEAAILFEKYLNAEKDNVQMFGYSLSMDNRARHYSKLTSVA